MDPIDRRLITHMNWSLLAYTIIIFLIGIGNLYSASGVRLENGMFVSPFYQRQFVWGVIGLFAMLLCITFDYRHLQSLALPIFLFTIILLIATLIVGKSTYGAKRWISLGFFNIQPGELAKMSTLILGARMLSLNGTALSWKRLIQIVTIALIPAALIAIQPDLGTALTIIAILGGMICYHGLKPYVLKTCIMFIPLLIPLGWFLLHDYQKQRILTFLDPTKDPRGSGYHIIQSQIAIGSGQFYGKGFLEGTQSQLRFLPEKHTDFVIAVFGEEWGFLGCVILMGLLCFFLLAIFNTTKDAKDRFGSTLAAGIFMYFFWQLFVNIGMVVGIMPVVGIPLPFLSYGGSSMLVNFILIGLVLNISMRRFVFKN